MVENKKVVTNFRFIVSMGIYLALWLGIAIFAGFPANFDISFNFGRGMNEAIREARTIVIEFSGLTALMSLSYIILLRQFARVLVFTTILVFCLSLLAAVCIFSYFCATDRYYEVYLAGLIISSIMFTSTITSVIVLRKKIQTATEVIRECSKIVVSFGSSLVFPILSCTLYVIVMIFSQRTFYYLLVNSHSEELCIFFLVINVFGFLWFMSFVTGWSQTVLSGCFCTCYWTMNKNCITNYRTILSLVFITTRYHLGTIACGSLLIILRKLIRFLLSTLGRLYILLDILLGYESLFGKLEKFLMSVNHDAYIMTSSHGYEFFKSAKDAFNLVRRNFSDTLVVTRVAEAILILGQILIIVISTLGTYGYCFWNYGIYGPTPAAVSLVIVSGFVITVSIFMVLKAAIDSTFLCILQDEERNDEATGRLSFMSSDLKAPFLQNLQRF